MGVETRSGLQLPELASPKPQRPHERSPLLDATHSPQLEPEASPSSPQISPQSSPTRLRVTPNESSSWTGLLSPLLGSLVPSTPRPRKNSDAGHFARQQQQAPSTPDQLRHRHVASDAHDLPSSSPKQTTRTVRRNKLRSRTRAKRIALLALAGGLFFAIVLSVLDNAYYEQTTQRSKSAVRMPESLCRIWPGACGRRKLKLGPQARRLLKTGDHPIKLILARATKAWDDTLAHQTKSAALAGIEYRKRYGRDPPPGFAEWFSFAHENDHVLHDEYDSLMAMLEPYWRLSPAELRRRTHEIGLKQTFSLVQLDPTGARAVVAPASLSDSEPAVTSRRGSYIASRLERFIGKPGISSMSLAINELDVPRVLPPWEELTHAKRKRRRRNRPIDYTAEDPEADEERRLKADRYIDRRTDPVLDWPSGYWHEERERTWSLYARTCPPHSAAREATDASLRPEPRTLGVEPSLGRMLDSAAMNMTIKHTSLIGESLCHEPSRRLLYSALYSAPRTVGRLYPVFSVATMARFADIVIPPAYAAASIGEDGQEEDESLAAAPAQAIQDRKGKWRLSTEPPAKAYRERADDMFWRGSVGAGRTTSSHALSLPRSRLVRLATSTDAEDQHVVAPTVHKPFWQVVPALNDSLNVAFTSLDDCGDAKTCQKLESDQDVYRFAAKPSPGDHAEHKIVISLDVIRSSAWTEWYTDRMAPWVHFIPLDPSLSELRNVHAFFLLPRIGSESAETNVFHLQRIAEAGQNWQAQHGRRRDADVYLYRLALEWSRLWNREDDQ